jgi:hypothetical protein
MISAEQIAHAMELLASGTAPWDVKSQTGVGLDDIERACVHGFDLFPPVAVTGTNSEAQP